MSNWLIPVGFFKNNKVEPGLNTKLLVVPSVHTKYMWMVKTFPMAPIKCHVQYFADENLHINIVKLLGVGKNAHVNKVLQEFQQQEMAIFLLATCNDCGLGGEPWIVNHFIQFIFTSLWLGMVEKLTLQVGCGQWNLEIFR